MGTQSETKADVKAAESLAWGSCCQTGPEENALSHLVPAIMLGLVSMSRQKHARNPGKLGQRGSWASRSSKILRSTTPAKTNKQTEGERKARILITGYWKAPRPLSLCAVPLGRVACDRGLQHYGLLALLTASAAGAGRPGAGGTGIRGAHHHVAAAGGAAHSGVDSRGSTRDAEIATDDATSGAAHA